MKTAREPLSTKTPSLVIDSVTWVTFEAVLIIDSTVWKTFAPVHIIRVPVTMLRVAVLDTKMAVLVTKTTVWMTFEATSTARAARWVFGEPVWPVESATWTTFVTLPVIYWAIAASRAGVARLRGWVR